MDIGFEHILDIDGQAQPGQIDDEADGRDLGFYCMQKRLLYGPKNKLQLTLYMAGVGSGYPPYLRGSTWSGYSWYSS